MSVTVKGCGDADWIRSIPLGARRRRCYAVCVDCDEDCRRGEASGGSAPWRSEEFPGTG